MSPPLTHPGSPADRLQTDAEHPTTSAIRSFPPSNTLRFSSYSASWRRGVVYELAMSLDGLFESVVSRAMEDAVYSIMYTLHSNV